MSRPQLGRFWREHKLIHWVLMHKPNQLAYRKNTIIYLVRPTAGAGSITDTVRAVQA